MRPILVMKQVPTTNHQSKQKTDYTKLVYGIFLAHEFSSAVLRQLSKYLFSVAGVESAKLGEAKISAATYHLPPGKCIQNFRGCSHSVEVTKLRNSISMYCLPREFWLAGAFVTGL